jgi:hypothetical protein
MEPHQLHTQVKRGGFPLLPFDVFRLAVNGCRDCMKRDRFCGKRYYMFGGMVVTLEMTPNCYKDQRDNVAVVNDRLNVKSYNDQQYAVIVKLKVLVQFYQSRT